MDKYSKRGLYIFGGCALCIILTGIVLLLYDANATGPVGSGKYSAGSGATLNGVQVIWVGVIMLLLLLLMMGLTSKTKDDK